MEYFHPGCPEYRGADHEQAEQVKCLEHLVPKRDQILVEQVVLHAMAPSRSLLTERLSKLTSVCKKIPLTLALLTVPFLVAAKPVADPVLALRECVRDAASAAQVAGCETQATAALRVRIKQLEDAIFAQLNTKERLLFQRNIDAWNQFLQAEAEMTEFAFGKRSDGLGAQLQLGESNKLLEQRFNQLRAYLSSIKQ
jgi:hypothetical protein